MPKPVADDFPAAGDYFRNFEVSNS